jgi:hypothetical protein
MNAKDTCQYLKPILDQFTDQERKELINFIIEYPGEEKRKNKKVEPIIDIPEMKSMLFQTEPFIPTFQIVPFIPTFHKITKE